MFTNMHFSCQSFDNVMLWKIAGWPDPIPLAVFHEIWARDRRHVTSWSIFFSFPHSDAETFRDSLPSFRLPLPAASFAQHPLALDTILVGIIITRFLPSPSALLATTAATDTQSRFWNNSGQNPLQQGLYVYALFVYLLVTFTIELLSDFFHCFSFTTVNVDHMWANFR